MQVANGLQKTEVGDMTMACASVTQKRMRASQAGKTTSLTLTKIWNINHKNRQKTVEKNM